MPAHMVKLTTAIRDFGGAQFKFRVLEDNAAFGKLKVRKATIVWVPKGQQKGLKMNWKRFDELMKEYGDKE